MKKMIPPDLSPAQRAQLKSIRALCFLVILNSGFGIGMYLFSSGKGWDWKAFGLFALAQVLYALLDVGEKYFSARGQMTMSEIFEMGRQMGVRNGVGEREDPTIQSVEDAEIKRIVADEEHGEGSA